MKGYEVKIVESSKDLTGKERLMIKDTTDAIKIDEATKDGVIIFTPEYYARLEIHNEHARDNNDYKQTVIVDTIGQKYVTGSESFFESFKDIASEMENENEEWSIKCYRVPSKNYSGKDFLTCSVV